MNIETALHILTAKTHRMFHPEFSKFHAWLELRVGHPVMTHQLAFDHIWKKVGESITDTEYSKAVKTVSKNALGL